MPLLRKKQKPPKWLWMFIIYSYLKFSKKGTLRRETMLHLKGCNIIYLEKEMTNHSSILAGRIPLTEEPGATVHGVTNSRTQLKWHSIAYNKIIHSVWSQFWNTYMYIHNKHTNKKTIQGSLSIFISGWFLFSSWNFHLFKCSKTMSLKFSKRGKQMSFWRNLYLK